MKTEPPASCDDDAVARRRTLRRIWTLVGLTAIAGPAAILGACGGASDTPAPLPPPPSGPPRATTLIDSLSSPWGMAFLPDGRMLITQKGGAMAIVSANGLTVEATIAVPTPVVDVGQGGLLDVALDPDFANNQLVYWTYSEGDVSGDSGTAVASGQLVGSSLQLDRVIFRQIPKINGSGHFGSRLAFRNDGTLFVTLGERQTDDPSSPGFQNAQNVANYLGKVVRINKNGTFPTDNPNLGPGALPGIWSMGHRNPQGAAIHPTSGDLWLDEHGPQGGDELNRIVPGGNYGWPIKSYGCPYGSTPADSTCWVGGGIHAPTYVEPVTYWVPFSIAPAGLMFYTGDKFPEWKGNAFLGALAGTALWRVELNGNAFVSREQLFASLGERIRCVRQGPDGWIYLLTDSGKLIRIDR